MRRTALWMLVFLLILLAACEGEPENQTTSQTPAQPSEPEPTNTRIEVAPLPPAGKEPTYVSVSNFPVSVIEAAGAQRPAYVSIEMAGFDVSELIWQVGRYEESCNRLIGVGRVLPETTGAWPDGVHVANFTWPAAGYFLSDSERADFVYLDVIGTARKIAGRLRRTSTGETIDANLLVDPVANRVTGLQSTVGQALSAAAGDVFQLFDRCLESDGSIRSVPGVELLFLEGGELELDQRPLTTGDYFLRLEAIGAENSASSITDFPVNNDNFVPDHQVYLNTEYGFQFLYPSNWEAPQLQSARLVTAESTGAIELSVTLHPDMSNGTAEDLKNLALSQFGDVTVLFEDQVSIGGTGALWAAYGYNGVDGSHTGILLAFIRDGVGYTVDLDGPETAEDQTINLMNTLVENWLFRPDITGPRAREWTPAIFNDLAMPVMTNYFQEELDNGWQRFTVGDGMSFLALRTVSLANDDLSDVVERWRDVAGTGVADFAISDDYAFQLNDREWSRTDFAYLGEEDLEIQGFVMVAEIDGRAVVVWAEMPITRYEEQSALFLLSLAGLR